MAWPTEAGGVLSLPAPRRRTKRDRKRRVQAFAPTWRRPVVISQSPPRRSRRRTRRKRVLAGSDAALFRGRFYADMRGLYRVFNASEYRFHRDPSEELPVRGLPVGWGDAILDAVNTDLVYLFKLDESGGNLTDVINALSAVAAGSPIYQQPGAVNKAVSFDGVDDEFTSGAAASLPAGDWTIALWVFKTGGNTLPLSLEVSGVRAYDINIALSETSWRRSSPFDTAGSNTGIPAFSWHHLIITRIAGNHQIYVDAVALTMDSGTFNDVTSLASHEISIGQSVTVFYTGLIEQLAIWKAALSASEIASLYNSGAGRNYRAKTIDDLRFAQNATLPHTPTDTFADGNWKTGVTRFNGVLDSNLRPQTVRGESSVRVDVESAAQIISPPQSPQEWRLEQKAGGVVRVVGFYTENGASRATQWAITYSVGIAPNDPDAPPNIPPIVTVAMSTRGMAVLVYDLPATINGFIYKVRLQVRRQDGVTWRYSESLTIKQQTAKSIGPTAPQAGHIVQGVTGEDR